MFSYLEKFKKMPKELQQIVSSPKATAVVNELEEKYKVDLASLVIKIMVKEVLWKDLMNILMSEYGMPADQAQLLIKDLKEKVFFQVVKYLNIDEQVTSNKSQVTSNNFQVVNNKTTNDDETEEPAQADAEAGKTKKIETDGELYDQINSRDEELREVVDKAARAIGIKLEQTDDVRRLESIIKTFKKGIRDDFDTIDALKKNKESGGLALSEKQAQEVIFAIGGKKPEVESGANNSLSAPQKNFTSVEQMRDVEYDLSALEKKGPVKKEKINMPKKKKISNQVPLNEFTEEELEQVTSNKPQVTSPPATQDELAKTLRAVNKTTTDDDETKKPAQADAEAGKTKKLETNNEVESKKPALSADGSKVKNTMIGNETANGFVISPEKLKKAEKFIADKDKKQKKQAEDEEEKKELKVRVQRPTVVSNENKPQVNDIIMPKKLQGPVEELANLNLVNFRRLDDDPERACKKTKQKISLLEEESYTKRQQGINGFRQSPLYKIYIAIGNESINQGISVKDVIKKKEGAGDEVLTMEEFNAILELNKELRV